MSAYEPDKVTICIVNYKTEALTRLCLRSIRKYTRHPYEVVVVDNDSGDGSLEYLRSLSWIRLIERPGQMVKSGSWAHGTGLDLGLESAKTEFFLAMHSDTIVHREGWLETLVAKAKRPPFPVCVGSGKLDLKPAWQVWLKRCTDIKGWTRRWLATDKRKYKFYIRAICALYRTETLMKENLRFAKNVTDGVTCGKQVYFDLLDLGYPMELVPEHEMARWVHHMAHATMVLNPEFTVRSRTEKKCRQRLKAIFDSPDIRNIMNDNSLDR